MSYFVSFRNQIEFVIDLDFVIENFDLLALLMNIELADVGFDIVGIVYYSDPYNHLYSSNINITPPDLFRTFTIKLNFDFKNKI